MGVKAIAFRCLVSPKEFKKVSEGGIDLSAVDEVMERNAQTLGQIVDIGEDFAAAFKPKTQFWGLKVGDWIFYAKYAGKWCKNPKTGEEVLMINDEDVCGKFEE